MPIPQQRRFATMGDNLFQIADRILHNQNVCRLLKYQIADPFSPDLPAVDGDELFNTHLLILPKIPDDSPLEKSFIVVVFDGFTVNKENFDFKLLSIRFDVVCPYDQWIINKRSLRPYLLMQELDSMFNDAKLSGIGRLQFVRSEPLTLSPELGGYSMYYRINEFN